MNIFVYSDESGVFDKEHNDIYVYGGLIFLSKEEKDIFARKYSAAEKTIRTHGKYNIKTELKATAIKNSEKDKLFRACNQCIRFGFVIEEQMVLENIFQSKKDKQRYLDYAYKVGLKKVLKKLITEGRINPDEVENIYIHVDEHTTATNGRYELREGIEQELKRGTYNFNYSLYFPPLFPKMQSVVLKFCNSKNNTLVRAADIVANKIFFKINQKQLEELQKKGIYIEIFPNKTT